MIYWATTGAEREKQHDDLPSVLHWSQFSRETFCFPPQSVSHPEPFLQDREEDRDCKSGDITVAQIRGVATGVPGCAGATHSGSWHT